MDQSVEMSSALLDLFPHVVVNLHIKDICDQVQRILVVLHFRVESCEVEAIREVVLVNFAEVFVAPRRYELG